MTNANRAAAVLGLLCLMASGCAHCAPASRRDSLEGPTMTHDVTGPFDVTLKPQPDDPAIGDASIGRMSIGKRYHGDLEAVGNGQMLAVRTPTPGSAGYVAMERVVGSLAGRQGSFTLQHSSTMTRGKPHQSITVVPDSGADELTGLAGSMTIDIVDGKHFYRFEYRFDAAPEM